MHKEYVTTKVNFMDLLLFAIHDSPLIAAHDCLDKSTCPVAWFVISKAIKSMTEEQQQRVNEIADAVGKSSEGYFRCLSLDPGHVWIEVQPVTQERGKPMLFWLHTDEEYVNEELQSDLRNQMSMLLRRASEYAALNGINNGKTV